MSSNKECPFTEEQLEWLANNLEIEVIQDRGYYGEKHTYIYLKLEGEQISYASLDLDL